MLKGSCQEKRPLLNPLRGEFGKAGHFAGEHIKFDAVHVHDREDVQVLNHIKAPDDPINHLSHTCFVIECLSDGYVAVFFLIRLGLRVQPRLELYRVLKRVVFGYVVGIFFFRAGNKAVLIDHFNDRQVFALMIFRD